MTRCTYKRTHTEFPLQQSRGFGSDQRWQIRRLDNRRKRARRACSQAGAR